MNDDFKDRVYGIGFSLLLVCGVWIVLVLMCGALNALPQTIEKPKDCDHRTDSLERFANMRLLPPATITAYNAAERKIYYKVDTAREIKIGSFDIEPDTVIEANLDDKKQTVWLLYCNNDGHLYFVTKVGKQQVKERP